MTKEIHATLRFLAACRFAEKDKNIPGSKIFCSLPWDGVWNDAATESSALEARSGRPPKMWPTCPKCLVETDRVLEACR